MEKDFDLQLASECAKAFATASGVGTMVTTAEGALLYQCGYSCAACRMCEAVGFETERCRETHVYGMHASERFGGKYIYFCAMGLTCFTSPIIGPKGTVAKLTAGPFRMVDEQDYVEYDLETGLHLNAAQTEAARAELQNIAYVPSPRVSGLSELLFMAVAFMNNVSEAERMMETRASEQQQGQISAYIHELKRDSEAQPYPYRLESLFLQDLSRGNQEQAQKHLNELLGSILFLSGGDMPRIRSRIYELLVLMSRRIIDCGADPESIFRLTNGYMDAIPGFLDVEALCTWLSGVMRALMGEAFHDNRIRHSQAVHSTMQYLQMHYRERVTLEAVAQHVSMSTSYLSRVFKREAGVSITQFLSRVRIEKSKELLAGSESLADIAQMCGFEDQSYYTKVFRRCCGMTPYQYRREHAKGAQNT